MSGCGSSFKITVHEGPSGLFETSQYRGAGLLDWPILSLGSSPDWTAGQPSLGPRSIIVAPIFAAACHASSRSSFGFGTALGGDFACLQQQCGSTTGRDHCRARPLLFPHTWHSVSHNQCQDKGSQSGRRATESILVRFRASCIACQPMGCYLLMFGA